MAKILIFTDIHIRPEGQTIIGLDPLVRFQTGLAHALRVHRDADHLIITGDLGHSGRVEEYQRVKAALAEVNIPVTLMLGNHDNREAFLEVFPDTPRLASGHIQRAFDLGHHRLITLDTLDGPPFRRDLHSGFLCQDRLDWLDDVLAQAPDRRTLLFTHHPPYSVGFPGMDSIRLKNDISLLTLLKRHPQVCHIFSGHVHRTVSGNINGLAFSMFKSTCHQMPMILAGDSESYSVDEPGAYGMVLLAPDSVIVHSEDFELAQEGVLPSLDAVPA